VQPLLPWESNKYNIFGSDFVELGIEHRMPMRHIVIYNIFPHSLKNGTIFEKKTVMYIKCVFLFPLELSSETFLILIRNEGDMIKT
jgi:hypothetical protein